MDVERAQRKKNAPPVHTSLLPPNHPFNIFYRVTVIFASLYGLNEFDVFHQIMRGQNVDHQWFKVGLAASIAMLGIKTYLEMYEGKIKKKKVEYQSYKTATHSVLFLWVFASFAFHYSLWGEYGIKTILIMTGMVGYGCLLQFMMLVPTWFQNIVLFIGLTFFLQQYQ